MTHMEAVVAREQAVAELLKAVAVVLNECLPLLKYVAKKGGR